MRAALWLAVTIAAITWMPSLATAETWLEPGDRLALDDAAQDGLEYGVNYESVPWVNPNTGNGGVFTPTSTHSGPAGNVCREYTVAGTIDGREEQIAGVACRQPDGSWREARSTTPAPETYVTPNPRPPSVVYRTTPPPVPLGGWWPQVGFAYGGFGYGYAAPYYRYGPGPRYYRGHRGHRGHGRRHHGRHHRGGRG